MFLFRLTLFINISVLSAKVLPVFSCRVTWNYGPFKEILRKKTDKPITVRTWSQNLVFRPRMNIYVKWVFFCNNSVKMERNSFGFNTNLGTIKQTVKNI